MWQCVELIYSKKANGTQEVTHVLVRDLLAKKDYCIRANTVVLAAGAVLTPQILFNSQIRPAALGHYLCFQPKAFCQVLLLQSVVDSIMDRPEWKQMVEQYRLTHPEDPIPIPPDDPLPQVITMSRTQVICTRCTAFVFQKNKTSARSRVKNSVRKLNSSLLFSFSVGFQFPKTAHGTVKFTATLLLMGN